MGNLYERIATLCKERNISGARLCSDIGISKGLLTDLKMGRRTGVSAQTANKICSYFGVTVGYLLGEEEKEEQKEKPTDDGELSPFAQKAVELFNDVPDEKKAVVLAMLRAALNLPE